VSSFFDYWAKTGADEAAGFHLLPYHGVDVAAVGSVLLERDPRHLRTLVMLSGFRAESLRRAVPYHLALHDLGKFSEPFQDQKPELVARLQGRRSPRSSSLRHDSMGYLLWRQWAHLRPDAREAGLLTELFPLVLRFSPASHRVTGDVLRCWMAAVLGHHGKPPAEYPPPPLDVFKAHPKAPIARSRLDATAFVRAAQALLAPTALVADVDDVEELIGRVRRASWWMAGFTILCDWLGSNSDHFHYEAREGPLGDYWRRALASASEAVEKSGLAASRPRAFGGIQALFPSIADRLSPLQQAACEVKIAEGPQLFVLEDLTGSGKTEAALVLAQRLMGADHGDGIYFALPTMATANAMHGRVAPLVGALFEGSPNYLLTHSGPRLTEQDQLAIGARMPDSGYGAAEAPTATAESRAWLADGRKRSLLAELGVGTIDQALLAALQSRHAALRLLGLHRHVLLVDEVHACDAYMLAVLSALLEIHASLGGSAIILSATLAQEQRGRLVAAFRRGLGSANEGTPASEEYPLLTTCGREGLLERPVEPRAGTSRSVAVSWHHTAEGAADRMTELSRAGTSACWVRNSVADALEAYQLTVQRLGAEKVTLFHARFALGDRLATEQEVLRRFGRNGREEDRRGQVVIATQVVEQSLDIDFDGMITDLCPIDRVIQRTGRLQRHAERNRDRPAPVIEILAPIWTDDPPANWLAGAFRRTAVVYPDPAVLWRTARELQRRGQLALPGEARSLVEAVFGGDADVPAALAPMAHNTMGQDMAHASVAQSATWRLDLGYQREGSDWSDEARTPTRLGEPTTIVRLARVDGDGRARAWYSGLRPGLVWPLSQVSVARRLVSGPSSDDEALRLDLEETQPFVGDDTATVLLREQEDGTWQGSAVAERRRGDDVSVVPVGIVYSRKLGLEVREA
jgi:CRISPR-associated endonuclease/helicase Cas3